MRKKHNCLRVVLLGMMLALTTHTSAQAQLLFTQLFIGAGNDGAAVGHGGTGAPVDTFAETVTFNGLDSHGTAQTMNMAGFTAAAAEFGVLRSHTRVSLNNLYYNPTNPDYRVGGTINPAGSPDLFLVDAWANFWDYLTFSGGSDPDATVQFIFTLDGTVSQTQPFIGFAFLQFGYNGGLYVWSTTDPHTEIVTDPFPVFWDTPIEIQTSHITDFRFDLAGGQLQHPTPYTEGSNVFSDVDYYHTARLTGIRINDAFGNPIIDFTTTSASGTQYPVIDAAIPEPATLGFLVGLLVPAGFALRRRRA